MLLAAAIFGFLAAALIGAIIYGRSSVAFSGDRVRAIQLAEEGVEAVRNIRDSGYANLSDGTFGLALAGGQWTLSGSQDTTGIFTRQVTLTDIDASRKAIVSQVNWNQNGTVRQVSVTARLTNWLAAFEAPAGAWANAVLEGGLNLTGTHDGIKVATSGNYAYMVRADATPDFAVIDISNPSSPSLAGSLSLSGAPNNIAVSGNFVYVATDNSNAELQIIDISNPSSPSLAGSFNAAGTLAGTGVFVNGTTVYLTRLSSRSNNTPEFVIINAGNPASPSLVGSYDDRGDMFDVYVSGSHAYVATGSNSAELMVINLSNPASPSLIGSLNLGGASDATSIDGFGSTVLLGIDSTLYALDVSAPSQPSQISGTTSTGLGAINDISVETGTNEYAFIGTDSSADEFQVVDITSPASLSIVRTVDISGAISLNGIAYNTSLEVVVGAASADAQEVLIFGKN